MSGATDDAMNKIVNEVKEMFNDICVLHGSMTPGTQYWFEGGTLVRLVGFHEDEFDVYYHVRYCDMTAPSYLIAGRKFKQLETRASYVGACQSLRGIISDKWYATIDDVFTNMGCPPQEEFIYSIATEEENRKMYGEARSFDRD